MIGKRTSGDVLREARRKESLVKRTRVLAVVDEMKTAGESITFLAVAKKAGVSNWLVYAEGVREYIEAARRGQTNTHKRDQQAGASVSDASLMVDLELAKAELARLRDERDRLKAKVQRALGQQVDQAGNAELETRLREVGDELRQRDAALAEIRADRDRLRRELDEALDTLGGLRASLKQMMRDRST